jgi:hypothetical protein
MDQFRATRRLLAPALVLILLVSPARSQVEGNGGSAQGTSLSPRKLDALIATVAGQKITYSEVSISPEIAQSQFESLSQTSQQDQAAPKPGLTLQGVQHNMDRERLFITIHQIVRAKTVRNLGIKVSPQELQQRWRRDTHGMDFVAMAKEQSQQARVLLTALDAVHLKGEDKDAVYNRSLREILPPPQWEIMLTAYRTPESRKPLKLLTRLTAQDFKPDKSFETLIIDERLQSAIDKQIASSDHRFATSAATPGKKPQDKRNGLYLRSDFEYQQRKRQEWWQRQYRASNIQIKDESFKDVLSLLFTPVQKPDLPLGKKKGIAGP